MRLLDYLFYGFYRVKFFNSNFSDKENSAIAAIAIFLCLNVYALFNYFITFATVDIRENVVRNIEYSVLLIIIPILLFIYFHSGKKYKKIIGNYDALGFYKWFGFVTFISVSILNLVCSFMVLINCG